MSWVNLFSLNTIFVCLLFPWNYIVVFNKITIKSSTSVKMSESDTESAFFMATVCYPENHGVIYFFTELYNFLKSL